jgi:acetyltransferase EpsM
VSRPVVIAGGGEHARVVLEALRAARPPFTALGYIDPRRCEPIEERGGLRYLGGDEAWKDCAEALAVLGFGSLRGWAQRRAAVSRISPFVGGWAAVVHGAAYVSPSAVIGEGTVVLPGAIVHTGAVVGAHNVINSGAIIEHDCRLGVNVHVAPGARLGGGVTVGDDSYIGIGATVRDHVRLGAATLVAMSAAVTADVGDAGTVAGIPARPFGGRGAAS